mgnify:CR=1 FL=1
MNFIVYWERLLSAKLNVDEKFDIIGNEFDIPLESDIRKDVNDMCNLSQGIKEQAYVKVLRMESPLENKKELLLENKKELPRL